MTAGPLAAVLADVGYQAGWFDVLSTSFMRNAFLAGTLVAVAAGPIGYFVVVRRDAFASHALAHIGFPGATAAVLVGVPVTLGMAVFCTLGGIGIGLLGRRTADRETATGSVLAVATALGVLFASLASESASGVTSILFGNLLAVTATQLPTFGVMTAVVLLALALIARPLLFASVDPQVAESRGVAVRGLGLVFLVLLALVTTMAVQVVGTLLLFALVITPAATALAMTARPVVAALLAAGVAVACVWVGLVVAVVFNLPPSFPIVTIAFTAWLVVTLAARRRWRGRAPSRPVPAP